VSETGLGQDPWSWLYEVEQNDAPDFSAFRVTVGVLDVGGDRASCLAAVRDQDADVAEILSELPADVPGDWIWVVPDDATPTRDALSGLLRRVLAEPSAAVIGGLLIEPRRRGAGTMVRDWAQTISANGIVRPLTEPGELYQGQLTARPALGVPASGMLVRGDVWRFLGGFSTQLPRSYWGLDFGWRANLAGYQVLADPDVQLVDRSEPDDPAAARAAGLALVAAHAGRGRRWLVRLRLVLVSLALAIGYLLGKDPQRSGEELRGLFGWIGNRSLRSSLRRQLDSLPVKPGYRAVVRALRPRTGAGARRLAEAGTARFLDWLHTFTGRGSAATIDEMTGDDFAETSPTQHRIPLAITGFLALVVGALAAARSSYAEGSLRGTQLLAAPSWWTDLLADYLQPVAGTDQVAGAPWTAITGIFSLLTGGRPEWLVTIVLVGCVPLAWLVAFRLLRVLLKDQNLAGLGALGYALVPAVIGVLNVGSFGTVVLAVLLPILGYAGWHWLAGARWSWRAAGAFAFWLLLACSLAPSWWAAAVAVGLVSVIRARRLLAAGQWLFVLAAPLLALVGPWGSAVLAHPGRLFTGTEPTLASTAAVEPWRLLVGAALPDAAAPVWLALVFFSVCWLGALVGAVRRPGRSGLVLLAAVIAAAAAIGVTRLAVQVPGGDWVRPQGVEWLLLLGGLLVAAAVTGLDGVTAELRGNELGLRHLGSLGLAVVSVAALVLGTGWWVWAGQLQVTRSPVGDVPAFVRNDQLSETPGRTLALQSGEDGATWSLLEGDFARLGAVERGVAFEADQSAHRLAASVAGRLLDDSGDDQLLPDLVSLGVTNITLAGGDQAQRMAINNVPGLGLGSGNDQLYVWPVPDSAVMVVVDGDQRTVTGDGAQIAAGGAGRTLRLAEPADPRWRVSVGGRLLDQTAGDGPGTQFQLGEASGELRVELDVGSNWWVWLQSAGLAILALFTAPSLRRRGEGGPRRLAGGGR
jgi:hypothetical protein